MNDSLNTVKTIPASYETIKGNFADLYDNQPEVYDVFAKNQITCGSLLDKIEERLKDCVNTDSGSFLDIGCGTGVMIEQLAPRFPHIRFTGIDPAENSLKLARDRCRDYQNVDFQSGTIESLQNSNKKFDVAFSSWGHIHWNELGGIMESVVKQNGISMLINNWGENDDFAKLWPEEPLSIFKTRRMMLEQQKYNVIKTNAYMNLNDESLFHAMSCLFTEPSMQKYKKSPFIIGIVMAWKQITS